MLLPPLQEVSSSQQHLEEARKEHDHLLESRRQLRRALEELRACKFELEAQVDLLRGQSQRLQKQVRWVHSYPGPGWGCKLLENPLSPSSHAFQALGPGVGKAGGPIQPLSVQAGT